MTFNGFEIKDIHSSDVTNIKHWKPNDTSDVFVWLSLSIGPPKTDASDIWQVLIATPDGLKRCPLSQPEFAVISDRNLIVVQEYSWELVTEILNLIVERCNSETQEATQWKLQRYFSWEYEDCMSERDIVS